MHRPESMKFSDQIEEANLTETDRQNASKSGGSITVVMVSPGKVQLLSPRYSCNGCVERTLEFTNAAPGSLVVENIGNMILTVNYNTDITNVEQVAELARRALEADPHNRAPVSLIFEGDLR